MTDVLWTTIGSMAACLTMFGFVPQLLKTLKMKFVRGVSFFMLVQTGLGVFLWILYGIPLGYPIIYFANGITSIIVCLVILSYFRYPSNSTYDDLKEAGT